MSLDPEPTKSWLREQGLTHSEWEELDRQNVREIERRNRAAYDRFVESLEELYGTYRMMLEGNRR
jgi:hypothetical protein